MKKSVSIILCVSLLFATASCSVDSHEDAVIKTVVAVGDDNALFAAGKFVNTIDNAEYITYNTSADAVIAVENGKADYAVLDEFEVNEFIRLQRDISVHSQCDFSLDYCAYFKNSDEELAELFNEALTELKNNGVIDRIIKCYSEGGVYEQAPSSGEKGELIMLCDPYFDYINYLDAEGNNIGIDVAIAGEICSYLGYSLEIVNADFDELFMKLQNGEGDFIMSGAIFNEERAQYYISSDVYFTLSYYVVERK